MSTTLTAGQHALLETELRLARQHLEQALAAQLDGQGRVAHAAELLADGPREGREHEADREVDQTRGDRLLQELAEVDDALVRLRQPGYGRCIDCAAAIPFDRLQHQPQALRCLDCQTAAEAAR